ncbi:hypothetical protein [uncultured Mameliella sp.]|uniref:hypothetical protein n=1 Tax=uncultured Mameliella sp. TaxID=1447087 RepID=UPI002611A977|nr:hypothetical protein [uncultured Mameliella sp.]
MTPAETAVTLHLCPPDYPDTFNPFNCAHAPSMQISDTSIRWKPKGGGEVHVRHARCLSCGAPIGTGEHGNIFVDIGHLLQMDICQAGPFRRRLIEMQNIYLQWAAVIFGPDGWKGDEDHRELAAMIDPHLTMRVEQAGQHGDGTAFVRVHIDEDYWPQPAPEADLPAQAEMTL